MKSKNKPKNKREKLEKSLGKRRKKIDRADRALLKAIRTRFKHVEEIGKLKIAHGLPLLQKTRWAQVMKARLQVARSLGLSAQFTEALYKLIHAEALGIQARLPQGNKKRNKK